MSNKNPSFDFGSAETNVPLLSIIITIFNYERFVKYAIESVLSQNFTDYELIVVDDGSSDQSFNIARSYEPELIVIKSLNQGQARAALQAFRYAKGRYIYFLDADDELAPGALPILAHVLERGPAKVQFQLKPIDANGRAIGQPAPTFPAGFDRWAMLQSIKNSGSYTSPPTSGNIFRRDVVASIDDIDYERAIDGVTLLLAPAFGEVISLTQAFGHYRVHDSSQSDWMTLNPKRLEYEADRQVARLHHMSRICAKLGIPCPTCHEAASLPFVLEHKILAEIARGRRPPVSLISRYWRAVFGSDDLVFRRFFYLSWSAGLFVLPPKARLRLAIWRRNPHFRPAPLRLLKTLTQRRRIGSHR